MSRYITVCKQISDYVSQYHRKAADVSLIAVSKTRSVEELSTLIKLGQKDFAENYLQEALDKIQHLEEEKITWHFIGAIQSKKARLVAIHFDWVHSLDRIKVANLLNLHRQGMKPLNVLLQVNIEDEATKSGLAPQQVEEFAQQVMDLPNLKLRGLMFMPRNHALFEDQMVVYKRAQQLFLSLKKQIQTIDQLSMGMTGDMRAAIANGATQLRIGTALFGPRKKS